MKSLRREMLNVVKQGLDCLGSRQSLIAQYIRGRLNPDGGFAGRDGLSDLYYTVFGLQLFWALEIDIPVKKTAGFLLSYEINDSTSLLDLSCLARCWGNLPQNYHPPDLTEDILRRIENFRSVDGGYRDKRGSRTGTVYGCFLALGAYEDLETAIPQSVGLANCICSLKTEDGGYANETAILIGSVPATAGAIAVMFELDRKPNPQTGAWLMNCIHPNGGFRAIPIIEEPDMLSTAIALQGLGCLNYDISVIRDKCWDYTLELFHKSGGFLGARSDDIADCEYTYYGLLALGHLR